MADTVTKVAAAPVRLMCRYGNGLSKSIMARGIAYKDEKLLVLTPEPFEVGILLTAMAGFLPTTQPAQVISVKRSSQPGNFVMELRIRPVIRGVRDTPSSPESAGPIFSLKDSAKGLAKRLQAAGHVPYYSAVFERASIVDRPGYLAATEAAVFSLLSEKGVVDAALLGERVRKTLG